MHNVDYNDLIQLFSHNDGLLIYLSCQVLLGMLDALYTQGIYIHNNMFYKLCK